APISIGHAGLAQLFFCITLSLALFTSAGWRATAELVDDAVLRRIALTTTLMIYGQILLGATMRHVGAGLAIPDFPLSFGHLLPAQWSAPVALHFAHRIGAVLVTTAIDATAAHAGYHQLRRRELVRLATLLVLFVGVQITLGAFVVWSGLQPIVNTAHVVNGALVLGTSIVLTLRSFRVRFERVVHASPSRTMIPSTP